MDTEEFKKLVAEFVGYDPVSGKCNESKVRELADEFECTRILVTYWASGLSNPREGRKRLVIKYIRK